MDTDICGNPCPLLQCIACFTEHGAPAIRCGLGRWAPALPITDSGLGRPAGPRAVDRAQPPNGSFVSLLSIHLIDVSQG
jgi:hypothetical protein